MAKKYLYEITPIMIKRKRKIARRASTLARMLMEFPVKVRSQDQVPKKILSHWRIRAAKKDCRRPWPGKAPLWCPSWQGSLANFDSGNELCYTSSSPNPYPELVWRYGHIRRPPRSTLIFPEPFQNAKPYRRKHCKSGILSQTHPTDIDMQHAGFMT